MHFVFNTKCQKKSLLQFSLFHNCVVFNQASDRCFWENVNIFGVWLEIFSKTEQRNASQCILKTSLGGLSDLELLSYLSFS